ncbi:MAG: SpoIIE family protein phosphatase [Anaerolineae bacterium]|nr:SpoIIE family protein phosphatase [Anaerolineae bacterium]
MPLNNTHGPDLQTKHATLDHNDLQMPVRVSDMLDLEHELDEMARDLVDSQDQLLALYEMNRSMRSNADLNDSLVTIAQLARKLLRVHGAFVALAMPDQPLKFVQDPPNYAKDDQFTLLCDSSPNATREWFLEPESQANTFGIPIQNGYLRRFEIRPDVCAVLGALNKISGNFRSPDIKLARSIADRASSAIETALLVADNIAQARLQTEMALAHRIQAELLPKTTALPDRIALAVTSTPAREIGGDFYDMQAESDRPFAFYVGDVSGKGTSAALLMAVTRTCIRSQHRYMSHPDPALILDRVNRDLYGDFTDVGMFVTVFYGQYLPKTSELVYANCGHSPVIYLPSDGNPRLLEADSPPIGVMDMTFCSTHQLRFAADDILVITSDGFNEAANSDGVMFGIDRMMASIQTNRHASAQEIVDALIAEVNTFAHGVRQDDQTVMVIKHL